MAQSKWRAVHTCAMVCGAFAYNFNTSLLPSLEGWAGSVPYAHVRTSLLHHATSPDAHPAHTHTGGRDSVTNPVQQHTAASNARRSGSPAVYTPIMAWLQPWEDFPHWQASRIFSHGD